MSLQVTREELEELPVVDQEDWKVPFEEEENSELSSRTAIFHELLLDYPPLSETSRAKKYEEIKRFHSLIFKGLYPSPERVSDNLNNQVLLLRFFQQVEREAVRIYTFINYERPFGDAVFQFEMEVLKLFLDKMNRYGIYTESLSHRSFFIFREDKIVGTCQLDDNGNQQLFHYVGDLSIGKILKDIFCSFQCKEKSISIRRLFLGGNGGIQSQYKTLKQRRPVTDPEAFWPFAPKPPREMAAEFEASDSNVLILYGEPGLGKSQYIAEMIKWKDENSHGTVFVCDDNPVFKSPQFTPYVHDMASNSWLVTEDAHEMIEARDMGNSLMAGILNAAEGITSGNVKFIISTNITSLKDVDHALYRPGRTLRVIPFKSLTADQANAARAAVGHLPIDFGNISKLSLAEALNWEAYQALQSEIKQGGFIGR